MSTLTLPLSGSSSLKCSQKKLSCLKLFLFIIVFTACNSEGDKESKNDLADSAIHQPDKSTTDISSTLFTLYLKNYKDPADPSSDQVEKLLPKSNVPHKIVLQFFKTKDNYLTLVAWSGKKGSKDFKHSELLSVWKEGGIPLNGNVFLGDQEINKRNEYSHNSNDIKALQDVINDPANKYILFIPRLEGDTVKFEITGVPELTQPYKTSSLNISPNPSPPRNAY